MGVGREDAADGFFPFHICTLPLFHFQHSAIFYEIGAHQPRGAPGRYPVRRWTTQEAPDGSKLDMIADSCFLAILTDFELALRSGDEARVEAVCRALCLHPIYVRAFEHMLEREEVGERAQLIERILTEYEFLSIFNLFDEEGME